jgi:hypothetical protein
MFIIKLLIRIIGWPIVAVIFLVATGIMAYSWAVRKYKLSDYDYNDYNNLFRLFTLRGLK